MRQVILDTETTGLSPESGDRVLEIGCVEMVNRRLTGRNLHFYLNPERRSHQDAIAVHGLSEEFLADKPLFAQIADELLEYLKDAEVIIHNAAFDVGFLDAELRRLERPAFNSHVHRVVDSLSLARESFPGKSNSLVIDAADVLAADLAARPIDFGAFELIVVVADEAECALHEAVLAEIDKASRGRAVWRPQPAEAARGMAQ